jgi:hypothetical protein
MPLPLVDILELYNGNKQDAVAHCLSVATNFPEFREEYEKYADMLRWSS